jgi:uncharacterized membrane protein
MKKQYFLLFAICCMLAFGFQNCGGMRPQGPGLFLDGNQINGPSQDGTSTGNPPQTSLTFAAVSAAVFQPYCVSCHTAGNAADGVRYDTYQATKMKGDLRNLADHYAINEEPAKECTPISNRDKALVLSWIEQGALE